MVAVTGAISSVNNKNTRVLKIGYKRKSETYYTDTTIALSNYAVNGSYRIGGSLSNQYTYDIRVTLGVVTRGIAGNVMLSDPLTEPIADEYVQFATKEIDVCLVPSELWATVHSPYASLSVLALSVRIMRYW